ncbi:peptidoglycan-binding protein [Hoeflea sp. TYP-13]|uniref:peptidoglycan-binding protein n=1 Tax=Hoeflea sp. TYP-13 TaxID=3230023 RepID=UPI0034C68910
MRMGVEVLRHMSNDEAQPNRNDNRKAAPVSPNRLNRAEIREVQRRLNERGYAAGPVDGAVGPQTRRAIAAFQSDAGFTATGRPDTALLAALRSLPANNRQDQAVQVTERPPNGFTQFNGYDFPGGDYRSGLTDPRLKNISQGQCAAQCARETQCRAYTYNAQVSVCILKDRVLSRKRFAGAISGVKQTAPDTSMAQADQQPAQIESTGGKQQSAELVQTDMTGLAGIAMRNGRVETSAGGGLSWIHGRAADEHAEALRYALMRLAFTRAPDLWDEPAFAFTAIRLVDGPTQARILQSAGIDPAVLNEAGQELYLDKKQYQRKLDEFAKRALLAAIRQQLPPIIAANAPKLPMAMFLPCRISLKQYDFERKIFPMSRGCESIWFDKGGYGEAVFGYNPEIIITAPIPTDRLRFDIPIPEVQARDFRADLYAGSADNPIPYGAMGIKARITDMVAAGGRHNLRRFTLKVEVEDAALYRADDFSMPLLQLGIEPVPSVDTVSPVPSGPVWLNADALNVILRRTGEGSAQELAELLRTRARLETFPDRLNEYERAWGLFFPDELVRDISGGAHPPPELTRNFAEWQKARVANPPATMMLETSSVGGSYFNKTVEGDNAWPIFPSDLSTTRQKNYAEVAEWLGLPIDRITSPTQISLSDVGTVKDHELWLSLPASADSYKIAPETHVRLDGSQLKTVVEMRVVRWRIDAGWGDKPLLVMDVEPVSALVTNPQRNQIIGRASFDQTFDRLPAERSRGPEIAAPSEKMPYSAETVDLLIVKFAPSAFDKAMQERMLLVRWHYEQSFNGQAREPEWGRFFEEQSPKPNEESQRDLMQGFKNWTVARAAAMPDMVTAVFSTYNANKAGPIQYLGGHGVYLEEIDDSDVSSCKAYSRDDDSILALTLGNACDYLAQGLTIPSRNIYFGGSLSGWLTAQAQDEMNDIYRGDKGVGPRVDCHEAVHGTDEYCSLMKKAVLKGDLAGQPNNLNDVLLLDKEITIADDKVEELKAFGTKAIEIDLRITGVDISDTLPITTDHEIIRRFNAFVSDKKPRLKVRFDIDPDTRLKQPIFIIRGDVQEARLVKVNHIKRGGDASLTTIALLDTQVPQQPDESLMKEAVPAFSPPPKEPFGPDVVGLRLGMSFEDAEKIIREHMDVGQVYRADRAWQPATATGDLKPYTSGMLYESEDSTDMIVIFDEPPAAPGTVMGILRRVAFPEGTVLPADIYSLLVKKYGKPDDADKYRMIWQLGEKSGSGDCVAFWNSSGTLDLWRNPAEGAQGADSFPAPRPGVVPSMGFYKDDMDVEDNGDCPPGIIANVDKSLQLKPGQYFLALEVRVFDQRIYAEQFRTSVQKVKEGESYTKPGGEAVKLDLKL